MAKSLKEIRKIRLMRQVNDSKKTQYKAIADSAEYKALRSLLWTKINDTTSTEEAISVALEALKDAPAEQVLTAVMELLSSVIDRLSDGSEKGGE